MEMVQLPLTTFKNPKRKGSNRAMLPFMQECSLVRRDLSCAGEHLRGEYRQPCRRVRASGCLRASPMYGEGRGAGYLRTLRGSLRGASDGMEVRA